MSHHIIESVASNYGITPRSPSLEVFSDSRRGGIENSIQYGASVHPLGLPKSINWTRLINLTTSGVNLPHTSRAICKWSLRVLLEGLSAHRPPIWPHYAFGVEAGESVGRRREDALYTYQERGCMMPWQWRGCGVGRGGDGRTELLLWPNMVAGLHS